MSSTHPWRTSWIALLLGLALAPTTPLRADFLKVLGKIFQADQALFMLGDRGAEKRLGYLIARFTLMTNRINRDPAINAWVNGVFERLKAAAPRSRYTYRIHVIDNPTINAFALPGGTIFIYRGMLDFVESDDELACVLGHEIAHAYRRHGLKRSQRNAGAQLLISKLFKNQEDMQVLGQVANLFTSMSFSRKNEDESDAIGMKIAMDAGYHPSGATTLWERMQTRFGSRKGLEAFLSSHPSHTARVANTRKWLAEHGQGYQRTRGKSYDSKENKLMDLAPNGGFEWQGSDGLPESWQVLEGEASWIRYPAPMTLSGRAAVEAEVPRGESLLLASGPVRTSTFRGPRVLSAHFHALSGAPTVYLGLEYLDRGNKPLSRVWHGARAHRLEPGRTELLRSPSISPEHFPRGAEKARILLYLGRLTGGQVLVDDVTLVPGTELDRRIAALLPGGELEDDSNGDGIPDGYEVEHGVRDDLDYAAGFASLRLEGAASGGPRTVRLTTPMVPIRVGRTYGFAFLGRSDQEGLTGRIHWLGYDRRRQAIQGAPPPGAFTSQEEWRVARDKLKIAPPPGMDLAYVRLRIEADLAPGKHLWVDDLRLEEVDEEGNPLPPPKQPEKKTPTVVDMSRRQKPKVVDVSKIGGTGSPPPASTPPPSPVPSKTATPAPAPASPRTAEAPGKGSASPSTAAQAPVRSRAPRAATPPPAPTSPGFDPNASSEGQDADWIPRTASPSASERPVSPRRAPR